MLQIVKKEWPVFLGLILLHAVAFAGPGMPLSGSDILDGTPAEASGVIVEVKHRGAIELDSGEIIVGTGPFFFYEEQGMTPPQEGDEVDVSGYIITRNSREMFIAMSITLNEQPVDLRDPETGEVLWECLSPGSILLNGSPFNVAGVVTSFGNRNGMIVSTSDSGDYTIYGIGPEKYWEELEVPYPVAGDSVEVTGYTISRADKEIYVAMNISVNGQSLDLRDSETGAPLWRGLQSGQTLRDRLSDSGRGSKTQSGRRFDLTIQ